MSALKKTWLHALIAGALGVALGLLWDSGHARAANVDRDLSLSQAAYDVCRRTGGNDDICFMQHFSEASALRLAQVLINGCADEKKNGLIWEAGACQVTLPYIRQRWGY